MRISEIQERLTWSGIRAWVRNIRDPDEVDIIRDAGMFENIRDPGEVDMIRDPSMDENFPVLETRLYT
jgi:hypothetical protein